MKFIRKLLIIQCLIAIASAQFDWIDNGIPLRQGVHIEWQRTGDRSPNGEMIFAWSDTRNGIRDIFAQKVNVDGEKQWGEDGIAVVTTEGRQEDPILIADDSGGAYVIWADYKNEPDTEGDVYGQHILSNGTLAWEETGRALTNKSGRQTSLNMCKDGEGGVFAIWKDFEPSSYGHIYGTHISPDGSILNEGEGFPIVAYPSYKGYASLEYGGPGSAVLIWQDERFGNGNGVYDEGEPFTDDNQNGIWDDGEWYEEWNGVDLFAQKISHSNGEIVGQWSAAEEGGKHICNSLKDQISPRVTHFNDYNTIIVWADNRTNGVSGNSKNDIYFQVLDENGNNLLDDNGIPIAAGNWEKKLPRVKSDGNFAFVVWEDERQSPNWQYSSDVFGQKVDMNGSIFWTENGRQIVSFEGKQEQVRLTPDGLGGVYIAWEDERINRTTDFQIYLQYIDVSNNELAENGISICSADYLQRAPLLKGDGSGGVYVMWEDQRTGSGAIFMQHLNSSQELSFAEDGEEQFYGIGTDNGGHSYSFGSIYLGQDENLLYWQDLRSGSLTYGQKISSNFNNEALDNGTMLCTNPFQTEAKLLKNMSNLFLGYLNNEAEPLASYQVLNLDLSAIDAGEGHLVGPETDSHHSFDLTTGADGSVYYVYTKNIDYWQYLTDLFIQKYDAEGNALWESSIQITNGEYSDDIVKAVHPNSQGGCVIIYEFSYAGFTSLKSISVDSQGEISGSIDLTNLTFINQFYESSLFTDDYIFVTWRDARESDYDIYGQFLGMQGNILGNEEGIEIAGYIADQTNSSAAINKNGNEILVCWEDNQFGENADISCSTIDVSNYGIGELVVIAMTGDEEMNPYVYGSESGTYLIAWENRVNGLDTEIYYQELNGGNFVHADNGVVVCDAPFDQMNPKIDLYSESDNSYIIYWDDKRSTGKAELTNIFCQSVTVEAGGGLSISYLNDWNLVGLPLAVEDATYTSIFPEAIPGTLFGFDGTYFQENELTHGVGFWLRFTNSGSTSISGESISNVTVSLLSDWNLISGLDQTIDISAIEDQEEIIIPGTLYGFSGTYEQVSILEAGKGYWIRTFSDGDVVITSNSQRGRTPVINEMEEANSIRMNNMDLYFGDKIVVESSLSYGLPPKPPVGAKDIRFSGDTKLCGSDECLIEVMSSPESTLSFECEIKDEKNWELLDESGNVFHCEGVIEFDFKRESEIIVLRKSVSPIVPSEFSLLPAFPNPFNPTTNIQFTLPELSIVSISIHDIQGALVERLVKFENMEAGLHTLTWNAKEFSSGIYFLHLETENNSQVKKLMLIK